MFCKSGAMGEWFWSRNAAGREDMCRMGQGSKESRDGWMLGGRWEDAAEPRPISR
jgi:hypothetical protein